MAMSIMEEYRNHAADLIEVMYYDEPGTGEGPTVEFFTLISHKIQYKQLKLWRDMSIYTKQQKDLVHNTQGLFPRPYNQDKISPNVNLN